MAQSLLNGDLLFVGAHDNGNISRPQAFATLSSILAVFGGIFTIFGRGTVL
jgi:hypothetical protein